MDNTIKEMKITGTATKMVNERLTLGEELPVTQLLKMTETICNFYSGYPEVTDDYKKSCPDCPLSLWYCDKLSTLTDEYLRTVMLEHGKIITLKQKYHIHKYSDAMKVKRMCDKEISGK